MNPIPARQQRVTWSSAPTAPVYTVAPYVQCAISRARRQLGVVRLEGCAAVDRDANTCQTKRFVQPTVVTDDVGGHAPLTARVPTAHRNTHIHVYIHIRPKSMHTHTPTCNCSESPMHQSVDSQWQGRQPAHTFPGQVRPRDTVLQSTVAVCAQESHRLRCAATRAGLERRAGVVTVQLAQRARHDDALMAKPSNETHGVSSVPAAEANILKQQ